MTVSKFGLEFLIQSPSTKINHYSLQHRDTRQTCGSKIAVHIVVRLVPCDFSSDFTPDRCKVLAKVWRVGVRVGREDVINLDKVRKRRKSPGGNESSRTSQFPAKGERMRSLQKR